MGTKVIDFWGERVEVVISSDETNNASCAVVQTSPPGGGPTVHMHTREDEVLTPLEGDYMFFETNGWRPMKRGEPVWAVRGRPHAFRNVGRTTGRVLAVIVPGQFDKLFETLAAYSPATDMGRIVEIASMYGVTVMPPDFAPAPLVD